MNKKEMIKQAATELFRQTGQITVREIANKTGVNVASINYYFGSKQALLFEIEEQMVADTKEFIKSLKADDTQDPVKSFIDAIYEFITQYPGFFKYLIQELANESPDLLVGFRKEITTGDFYEYIKYMIVDATGLIDPVEINNRIAIFFTSLAVSAITVKAISIQNNDGKILNLFINEENYKAYLKTLFKVLLNH